MNTKEQQLEEMANVLEQAKIAALGTIGSLNRGWGMWYAEALYAVGYRKVDEEPREEIKGLHDLCFTCNKSVEEFAERLKEKFKNYHAYESYTDSTLTTINAISLPKEIDKLLEEYQK